MTLSHTKDRTLGHPLPCGHLQLFSTFSTSYAGCTVAGGPWQDTPLFYTLSLGGSAQSLWFLFVCLFLQWGAQHICAATTDLRQDNNEHRAQAERTSSTATPRTMEVKNNTDKNVERNHGTVQNRLRRGRQKSKPQPGKPEQKQTKPSSSEGVRRLKAWSLLCAHASSVCIMPDISSLQRACVLRLITWKVPAQMTEPLMTQNEVPPPPTYQYSAHVAYH